jgi:transglutaminase-like putative cysteine protease
VSSSGRPPLLNDLVASVAVGLFSLAVAVGFARVFSGWVFLDDMILVVLVGHGAGLILRRLPVSAWLAVPAAAALTAWTIGVIHYRSTYSWGLPTSETWTLFSAEMQTVQDQFSVAVAPVFYGAGWDVLAAIGLGAAVVLADVFAFRAFARAETLVPGGVLFVFIGALGDERLRVALTVGLVAAGVLATGVLRSYHAALSPGPAGRSPAARRLVAPAALGVALVVAVVAGVVGPRLPGAGAEALYDTKGRGGGVTEVVSPLVDIRSRLTNRSNTELFAVTANIESYWRSSALPRFDGTTWGLPERSLRSASAELSTPRPGSAELRQQIRIVNLGGSLLPAAPDPFQASGPNGLRWVPETATLVTVDDELSLGDVFQVVSASPRFTASDLAAATSTDAGDPVYLELPGGMPAIVGETAAAVTAGASTPYETALALQNWFQNEFDYSLEVQPGHGNNAIESFLRSRVGYCEQFAGTYAAMMRTLGIPARVAVGFTPGIQVATGTFSVLGKHAHAWPEVWFDGWGWVAFEPTPGRGAPGAESYTDLPAQQDTSGAEPADDPADGDETPVPTTVVADGGQDPQGPNLPAEEFADPAGSDAAPPLGSGTGRAWPWTEVLLAGAVMSALIAPALIRRARARRATQTADRQLAYLWNRSVRALGDAGVPLSSSDTPLETATATARRLPIAARPVNSLAEVVTEAMYRPEGTTGYDVVRSYGSSTLLDCRTWTRQIERAVNDSISVADRTVRYFTRLG